MSNTRNLQQKLQTEIVELTKSINEIISNFKQLKNPIQESQVKVPMATNQLDKISEQTEAATNHMLDLIENISIREEEVIKGLTAIKKLMPKDNEKINNLLDGVIEKTNINVNDAFTIMNALQFQDITSQQMNHAASLLEEIETKLTQICTVFGIDPETSEEEPRDKKERVYDPHADLYEKKTEQKDVDSMFDQVKK
ncbi:MAG: protein phosphatase CheZ [candidate division Zixibacteria bacterium]|nr:protein phosphatase CheZ [candidate division Zixibacteria bacterium]